MRISLDKLEAQGFETGYDPDARTLEVWPKNPADTNAIVKLCDRHGLNERSTDMVLCHFHDVQVLQALMS